MRDLARHEGDHAVVVDRKAGVVERAAAGTVEKVELRRWDSSVVLAGTVRKPKASFCAACVELLKPEACHWKECDGWPADAVAVPCGASWNGAAEDRIAVHVELEQRSVGVDADEAAVRLINFRDAEVGAGGPQRQVVRGARAGDGGLGDGLRCERCASCARRSRVGGMQTVALRTGDAMICRGERGAARAASCCAVT